MTQAFNEVLDVRGQNCPMPLVNARKQAGTIDPGKVLKVIATDKGSVADFQGWARIARNVELIAQETESMDGTTVYVHYVKRTA